jgi:uncharacterized protein DUF2764
MNKHYYLIASLPRLEFDQKSPFTREDFLSECDKWLSPGEMILIQGSERQPEDSGTETALAFKAWQAFDLQLRAHVAGTRRKTVRSGGREAHVLIKEALEKRNPLEREKALEMVRWKYLEGEEHKYPFDFNWIILFYLKLQILERLQKFNFSKGTETFDKLCEVKNA